MWHLNPRQSHNYISIDFEFDVRRDVRPAAADAADAAAATAAVL